MSKNDENVLDALDDIVEGLEVLRSHVVDLEAMANAAAQTLEHIPNITALLRKAQGELPPIEYDIDKRLQLGRLSSLVTSTATKAHQVLDEVDDLLERAERPPGSGDDGSGRCCEPTMTYNGQVLRVA